MTIEKINREEFQARLNSSRAGAGRVLSLEGQAILDMTAGEAIKFPCRWTHGVSGCIGINNFRQLIIRHGGRLSGHCHDGTVYLMRAA